MLAMTIYAGRTTYVAGYPPSARLCRGRKLVRDVDEDEALPWAKLVRDVGRSEALPEQSPREVQSFAWTKPARGAKLCLDKARERCKALPGQNPREVQSFAWTKPARGDDAAGLPARALLSEAIVSLEPSCEDILST
jgi:hypothetical protein